MKRYILSIGLLAFAVGSVGSYYAIGSSGDTPEYRLVATEGDAAEGERFTISGHYLGGVGSKSLEVSAEGTEYRLGMSFYDVYVRDTRYSFSEYEDLRDLKREKRNFMRARSNVNGFYKDAEWLIYAEGILYGLEGPARLAELKIDLMEEATGRVTNYRITTDNSTRFQWLAVEDVQRIGDEVHVLARVRLSGSPEDIAEEFRDYVVDLRSGQLVREAVVVSEKLGGGIGAPLTNGNTSATQAVMNEISLSAVSNEVRSQPSEYVVLRSSTSRTIHDEGGKKETTTEWRITAYNYRTGELTPLSESIPASASGSGTEYRLSGIRYSVMYYDIDKLWLKHYNVTTGQEEAGNLELTSAQLGGKAIDQVRLAQNRLYVLLQTGDKDARRMADSRSIAAVVIDADSGKVLYRGEAVYTGAAGKAEEFRKNLWLTNIQALGKSR
ncbi:hypothetical protein [Cohnella boryungensis]|uniref:Transcriptional regulator n=1 Tax=Cohnella boryungensis TaxID=768479 RepID=A0ABV8SK07_9BACL